jgi:hypothetical protein
MRSDRLYCPSCGHDQPTVEILYGKRRGTCCRVCGALLAPFPSQPLHDVTRADGEAVVSLCAAVHRLVDESEDGLAGHGFY